MVFIEKMIVEGFKSFRKKTVINFDKGFTAIVGTNGSGKSNIIDAFVFVLGTLSSKKLRANKSSDLISNGGNGLKPAKSASVRIVFDNKDGKIMSNREKVTITRKINRDGKGIYKLNGKRTTRTEIRNVLDISGMLPNSSNMIMQGKLFKLINMNETQRRQLIEDIAGIASYNEKKSDAEDELLSIQENLGNISLLLNEVYLQMEELKKEKMDAEKFLDLSEQEQIHKNAILQLKVKNAKSSIKGLEEKQEQLKKKLDSIAQEKAQFKKEIETIETKIQVIKEDIKNVENSELYRMTSDRKKLQKSITENETSLKYLKQNVNKSKESKEKAQEKISQLENQEKDVEASLNEIISKKSNLENKINIKKVNVSNFEEKIAKIDEDFIEIKKQKSLLYEQKENVKEEQNYLNTSLQVLNNKLENISHNKEKLEAQIFKNHEKIGILKGKVRELKAKKKHQLGLEGMDKIDEKAIKNKMDNLNKKIKDLEQNNKVLKPGLLRNQKKLMELRSEIKVSRRMNSGSRAIKAIYDLKRKNEIPGIFGTIADLGSADPKFNIAMEMAAGNRFNYVVVDHPITAQSCIEYLKKHKLGRASFIPLSKIHVSAFTGQLPQDPNVYGRAVDLITFEPKYKKAFEYIFGRTVVVEDISTARQLNVRANRVTLDGDKVSSSNLMTGGQKQKSRGLSFKSNDEEKLKNLEAEVQNYKNAMSVNEEKIDALQKEISRLYKVKLSGANKTKHLNKEITINQSKIEQIKESINEKENEIENLLKEKEKLVSEREVLEKKNESVSEKLSGIESSISKIDAKMDNSEELALKDQMKQQERQLKQLRNRSNKLEIELTKKQTLLTETIQKSREELKLSIKEHQKSIEKDSTSLTKLENTLAENQQNLEDLSKKIAEKSEKLSRLLQKKKDLKFKVSNKKINIGKLDNSLHPLRLKENKCQMKSKELTQKINEWKCNVNPEVIILPELMEKSVSHHKMALENVVSQKTALGAINMRSIEKYNECEKRFNDLELKNEQVIQERESILVFIEELEKEKKAVFMNTFDSINKNFAYVFSKLSPDGEAKLALENPEDPFEGGVNIMARPGKKKWCLTQAMSGGEKTLTIIALILGIQMHIPSPYYVLDEIDAALDDANAALVADMVKDLSNNSQFVIITHRDVTMARVDQLLGVSNQEGVSSVINLSVRSVLKNLENEATKSEGIQA